MAERLGAPYRVLYRTAEHETGLADVVCVVLRPDLTMFGTFAMPEVPNAAFAGTYSCLVNIPESADEGQYVMRCFCLSNSRFDDLKVTFERTEAASIHMDLAGLIREIQTLKAVVASIQPRGQVVAYTQTKGEVHAERY